MSDLDDIVREFLVESHEGLDQVDRDLVALEQSPGDRDLLAAVFRCIHTIKGTCGFLGFERLESVTHVGENLLSLLRDGHLSLTPEIADVLLRLVDAVREILGHVEAGRGEGDGDYAGLVARLTALADPTAAPPAPPPPVELEAVAQSRPAAATEPADEAEAPVISRGAAGAPIRVDVALLDKLMNLVGELVLARNQILQCCAGQEESALQAASQRLNLITTELQEGVMKTRMQPIDNVWSKLPRMVRDLAQACGKQVRVEMDGRETELDRTIIEAIKDPLTHIVRNAIDHGLETPAMRSERGKPVEGRLTLRAYHEGGQVNIEIGDDGRGIDADRVRQKAVERGLLTLERAGGLSDRDALGLIFMPGFSTAEKVTNVSGRGVGMDVVRTNVERIGGAVEVQSTAGEGTVIRIKIPLTLAIIPALIVTAGGDRFAIPQASLLELVRLEAERARTAIESVCGAPVYRLRGTLLPLVSLSRELGLAEPPDATGEEAVNVVVLQAGEGTFGLVVDAIHDTEEIVVKPIGRHLRGVQTYAGATIMGDGRVALILDVFGLARQARVLAEGGARAVPEPTPETAASAAAETLLLLDLAGDRRMAIPLSAVARLEEFPRAAVERSIRGDVVQYRGAILPLLPLAEAFGGGTDAEADPLQVVVYGEGAGSVGLVVGRILDVVEERLAVERRSARGPVYGTAVIRHRVTDLVDIEAVVRELAGAA